ncbi:hypothetical protein ACFXHA_37885 [Nocardia sp. NPDC059240]|uniref:hypothetical protein n=1 Tax=Nocardia sp. NPDC059240 TaxID=3346786 RepID=UPI003696CEF5
MQDFHTNPDRLKQPVELQDDAGITWRLRRRRIDLRVARRLLHDSTAVVILGERGGTHPRLVADAERPRLWSEISGHYLGPGGGTATGRFLAHEFRADPDRRMLYVEEHC